jgi:hypothetical protein
MKHNIKTKTAIGVIGMPRSGTTIVTSFINSLDRATMWGEAHRVVSKTFPRIMATRHGTGILMPDMNVLSQVETFADKHNLLIYGTKDVYDSIVTDPVATYRSYGERYDHVFVTFRDPRKTWASMKAIGHARELGMTEKEFIWKHNSFVNYCVRFRNATPIILERFRKDPIGYMSIQMGIEISGPLIFQQYTGGGDVHAMYDKSVRSVSSRIPDPSLALDEACAAYMEVYRL